MTTSGCSPADGGSVRSITIRRRLDPSDRQMAVLAAQALGSLAVEPLYVLVDTAIVGRLGTAQLGGLALAGTVLSFVVAGCNFLAYGTTERVARRLGAGDRVGADLIGVQAMWIAAGLSAVLVPLLAGAAPLLGRVLGGSGDVLDYAVTYLRIGSCGVPFILIALAAQGIQRGATDFRSPLIILLSANLLNVVLEIVFVFGFDWGVPGSAASTVIAQAGAAIAFLLAIRRRLTGVPSWRPDWEQMRPLVAAGRHLLVRVLSILAVLGGSTAVAARIDTPTLAAHQIALSMFTLLALTLDAFAVPAQTLVADKLGRDDPRGAYEVALRAERLSLLAAAVVAVIIAGVSAPLPHLFTSDPAVIDRAVPALLWLAVLLLPGAVAFAHDGVLIGAADYRFLGIVALIYFLAVIPIGLLVLGLPSLGINGIWAGLTAWMAMRAAVNHRRTQHRFAKHT
jgi:putative MATE family efflux protein